MSMRAKRIRRTKRIRAFIVLIVVIAAASFGFMKFKQHKLKADIEKEFKGILKADEKNKETGDIESIVKYDKNHIVSVHYPSIGVKAADKNSKALVEKHIDEFNKDIKGEEVKSIKDMQRLHIEYESYDFKDKLASIKFNIEKTINGKTYKDVETVVYSKEDGKKLGLSDIFIDQSIEFISRQVSKDVKTSDDTKDLVNENVLEHLTPEKENFTNFLLKKDSVEMVSKNLFDAKDIVKTTNISLKDLEMYSKYNLENFKKLSDKEIEEKVELAKKGSKIRPGLDPKKPMIALTFDDGPSKNATPRVLNALKKVNGAGTFFVLGQNAGYYPDLIKRMAEEGHEIGNHSFSHKQLTKLSVQALDEEVNKTQETIRENIGYEPRVLRPTYGAINKTVETEVDMPLILWSIDTLDWKYRNADRVTNEILTHAKDGDIILMHDLYDSTAQAVENTVEKLSEKFQLVTITEMYELKGVPLESGKRYISISQDKKN